MSDESNALRDKIITALKWAFLITAFVGFAVAIPIIINAGAK